MEAKLTTHPRMLPREAGDRLPAGLHAAGLMIIVLMMAAASFGCGAFTAAARRALAAGRGQAGASALPGETRQSSLNLLSGSLPKANPAVDPAANLARAELNAGPSAEEPKSLLKPLGSSAPAPELPAAVLPGDTPPSYIPPAGLAAPAPTPTPLVLPEYEIPEPEPLAFPTESGQPSGLPGGSPEPLTEADTSAVTRLVIPRMGLDAVVKYVPFSDSTWLIGGLRNEIAWMGDTSWPGLGGNTGLAGHYDFVDGSPGPFWRLRELAPGDTVHVYTEKYLYTYTVREHILVDASDLSVIAPTDNPQITLITCATYDRAQRVYTQRLIVYADLTAVNPIQ